MLKKIYSDKFAGWSIGQLQTLDNFDDEFDNQKTDFQIKIGGNITSIIASKGSSIVIQDVLIVPIITFSKFQEKDTYSMEEVQLYSQNHQNLVIL